MKFVLRPTPSRNGALLAQSSAQTITMHMMKSFLTLASIIIMSAQAFAPLPRATKPSSSLFGGNPIANFFEELDNFIDDATSRRLGNGAAFYGKRKSNFYGEDDAGKKKDSNVADPTGTLHHIVGCV